MYKNYLRTLLTTLVIGSALVGRAQTYCVTSPSLGNTGDIITKVDVANGLGGTYTNTSTYSTAAPAYYTSYPNAPINLAIGVNNTVSITFGPDPNQYSAIWIDYNHDGIFQASENVALTTTATAGNGTKTYTFSVPPGTQLGATKMRIRGASDAAYTAGGACTTTPYGETEDYNVNIVPAPTCLPPTAVSVANVSENSAQLNFTGSPTPPAEGYDYFYTSTNTPPAANAAPNGNGSGSPITITGNFGSNPSFVWVKARCSATDQSIVAGSPYVGYCKVTGSTSSASYFNNFKTTGGITNISNLNSGFAPGGYQNATGMVVTQVKGSSVSFTTSLVGTTVGVTVWVDWNDNLTFDANERVYYSGGSFVSTANGSFTVPASALPGKHRMRAIMDYNSVTPNPCGISSGRGEVEDFTFAVPPPAPAVTGTTTVCPGATTTITASGCIGTVTWSNGATGSSINVPAGSYTAICSVDSVSSPASVAVVVTETPVPPPTISGGTTVCPGATATLTASGCSGTITWSNGATGSSISAPAGSYTATCTKNGCVSPASSPETVSETQVSTPTITASSQTVCPNDVATLIASGCNGYIIWSNGTVGDALIAPPGTYTAICNTDGCEGPASAPITITEKTVTTPVLSGDASVCPGATATLTASNCNGDVTWSNGATGSSITVPAGTYTATCTFSGCISPASNPATITEILVSTPMVSGASPVCPGATATLTASNCNGDVTWSNGATGSSTTVPAGTYTATCTVMGCVSPASAPATVTELPVTTPVVSGDASVCPGATATLTASNCNGDVTWSNGATGASISAPAGSYTATCTMNGCVSPASSPQTVSETQVSTPFIASSSPTICPGDFATLIAGNCNGNITWSNGASGNFLTAPAGTYTAICNTNGCDGPASSPVTITEIAVSTPVVSDASVCPGATATLTASNCNGDVTWSNGATGSSITVPAGSYTATCTVMGCVSTASAPATVTQLPSAPPINVTVGPTTCPSGNATLTATGCSGGTIVWSNGATGSSISAPPGTYTASCTMGNPISGCGNSPTTVVVPPYASPCPTTANLITNGSFEAIQIGGGNWSDVHEPGWKESAPGNSGYAQILNNYLGIPAKQGNIYIELNASVFGILSQTVAVQQGAALTLTYYHRSRGNPTAPYGIPEKLRVDIIDSATNTLLTSLTSSAVYGVWTKFSTSFVPTGNKVIVRFNSLNGLGAHTATPSSPASLGAASGGNELDDVSMVYAGCGCPCIPTAPVVTTTNSNVGQCQQATLTATGCDGGNIKWNNGATGTTLTTNAPGSYSAQCILPGTTCASTASSPVNLTAGPDIEVSCPTIAYVTNGSYRVTYTVKNNGSTPVTGKDTIVINGENSFIGSFTNLAAGDSTRITFTKSLLACGSTASVTVKASSTDIADLCPANNTCSATQPVQCFPPLVPCCGVGPDGWPNDPNVKRVSPMRSLEGGIFPSDEWLTYTVHCQNDGLGICHNAIMVDTIDTSKLDLSTLQILSSWDPVQLTHINANTVSFDFIGVNLTSSTNDLPNSQTEVVFKIKRLPNQPIGTEIFNKAGIYFDTQPVVNTEYAASKIIEPCPASQTSPGIVNSDIVVTPGTNVSNTFTLSGYDGLITGWEVSTDPTFATGVQKTYDLADTFTFNGVVNTPTYVRATVQTGGCAITGSKVAVIQPNCGNLVENGSFENPAIKPGTWALKSAFGWINLADNNTEEIHNNTSVATASEGQQFIELNGYNFGDIYQDVKIENGKTIQWKIDHKARAYTNEVINIILSAPDGSNAQTVSHTGSLSNWETVTGSYTATPTQADLRIRIKSLGGTSSVGNLIDNVQASYDGCESTMAMRAMPSAETTETPNTTASLVVHPNPVHTIADVDLKGFETGTVSIHVFDATGHVVKSLKVQHTKGTPLTIQLAELKAGMYLIKASQNDKMATAKIAKQ